MATAVDIVDCNFLQAWWLEISVVVFFLLGFAILRGKRVGGRVGNEESSDRGHEDAAQKPGDALTMGKLLDFLQQDPKVLAETGNTSALQLFNRARTSKCHIDEALCSRLLERCSGAELPSLVGEVARFSRTHLQMTTQLCSVLMRAYADAGMPQEARRLYDDALARGVELQEEADDLYDAILSKEAVKSNS
mmetsp:Transcript_91908/g.213629  ORF Transcript_91908/g.213629 Transcript_91908/m.213629 type:complete len:192 (-) Transcript_91908:100-675(-)